MRALHVIAAATAGLLLGAATTGWWTHSKRGMTLASSAPTQNERKVLYWYDPMVPTQHFDHSGKSPFMDMALVPKYADDIGGDAGVVNIDPRQVQNLGVRTARASLGSLRTQVRASGTVAFDERAVSVVQARAAGVVAQLLVRAPMTTVRQGQPLLTLLVPEWTAAQEEYLALRRAQAPGLDALRSAARQRLLLLGMDEAQVRAIEGSGRAQTRITIVSPQNGVLSELAVRDGAAVTAGALLLRLNGLDSVWVNAAIPQAQLAHVRAGATVRVALAGLPDEQFDGEIEALLPEVDVTTRTQTARVVLRNPRQRLVPGQFAQLDIVDDAATEKVLVPSEAVIVTGQRAVVMIAEGQGHFRAQEVRLGGEADGRSEILDGVQEGEEVVLSGQFLIDSEASLSGALGRLEGVAAPSHTSHDAKGSAGDAP